MDTLQRIRQYSDQISHCFAHLNTIFETWQETMVNAEVHFLLTLSSHFLDNAYIPQNIVVLVDSIQATKQKTLKVDYLLQQFNLVIQYNKGRLEKSWKLAFKVSIFYLYNFTQTKVCILTWFRNFAIVSKPQIGSKNDKAMFPTYHHQQKQYFLVDRWDSF